MKLSIIIPVFNEEDTITKSIQGVIDVHFAPHEREIIIVNDASTDQTKQIVESFVDKVILINHSQNLGKGAAIRTALKAANGDIVLIHDADLEYDPADLPKLVEPIASGDASASYGSRFLNGARPDCMKFQNWLANRILAITANLLFGANLTDEATCYKAIRRDILLDMNLRCQRFEFCPEVTAKLLRAGHKIIEVPVWYHARTVAEGKKIHWYDGLEAIWTLVKYRFVK